MLFKVVALLLALAEAAQKSENCVFTEKTSGHKYDFSSTLKAQAELGYATSLTKGDSSTYISFCEPINGSAIDCPLENSSFVILKTKEKCLSIGNQINLTGTAKDPFFEVQGGKTCDLGKSSSGAISLQCNQDAGPAKLSFFRFNEFCVLNTLVQTDIMCNV
ncbi:MAG: hypothetical protein EZS28_023551 [Streblomastix strix]|uniref:Uncharacterized protein n=1 Tax=Streblomastix strix TaxID=222440 RepID=A0A5J4VEG1_9EUKA|nr:MAG: hypothetical protein EZS28_023551 [Streblomastix strix]